MTDLEKHVNQPGRDKLVKKVREKINELGITYIYYQFISVTGRVVGKGIPADHWERTAEKGFQLVYGSTANLFVDRHKIISATALKLLNLLVYLILKLSVNCLGIKELEEFLLHVLETEKKDKIQEDI